MKNTLVPRINWPTREVKPIYEFSNTKLFCLAFPWLFPGGVGDIKECRKYELEITDWAQNLLYYQDGRFAKDKLWSFFTLNYIYRRRNYSQSQWFVKDFMGNNIPSLESLQQMISDGDVSFIDKLMYFGKIIPGTAAYWRHKKAELYSWINHHVEHGRGALSIFLTLSCGEFFWPDLRRLLQEFVFQTSRKKVDLEKDFRLLNQLLNDFSLIVQDYFHKRVEAFLEHICKKIFGIKHFWGRMEFSKLRGQINIHLVGIIEGATRPGGIQHQMFIHKGDVMKQTKILAEWARKTFNLSAEIDENLINNAVAKHEKTKESPCSKRLSECTDLQMDCAELCSFCQMHSCSDYCLRTSGKNVKKRTCRMGCGDECPAYSKKTPGWTLSLEDAIIKDKRGFQKLSLKRNHPRFLQTSFYCLQSWRANCDVSIMIFDSDPKHPDLSEIAEVTDYVVSYACKGNVSYALEKEQIKDFTRR